MGPGSSPGPMRLGSGSAAGATNCTWGSVWLKPALILLSSYPSNKIPEEHPKPDPMSKSKDFPLPDNIINVLTTQK